MPSRLFCFSFNMDVSFKDTIQWQIFTEWNPFLHIYFYLPLFPEPRSFVLALLDHQHLTRLQLASLRWCCSFVFLTITCISVSWPLDFIYRWCFHRCPLDHRALNSGGLHFSKFTSALFAIHFSYLRQSFVPIQLKCVF